MRSWPIGQRPVKASSDVIDDDAFRKTLTLLFEAPTFAMQTREDGSGVVKSLPEIPAKSGIWLLAGVSHLANGAVMPSVFMVNTDGGDTITRVYWKTDAGWCDTSHRPALLDAMGMAEDAMFPCRFETTIPLGSGLSLT